MNETTQFLTRVRLRRDVSASALRAVLMPDGAAERAATTHRLVWTLFADAPDRKRDFLWREAEPGTFYCLSARPPEDRHGLFDIEPPKPFAPALSPGDRLGFLLRVNATRARGGRPPAEGGQGVRGKPCDIVMDALHRMPKEERADARRHRLVPVAHEWLSSQGARHGFMLPPLPTSESRRESCDELGGSFRVRSYRVLNIERGRGVRPLRIGVLDLEGVLEVCEPMRFLEAVRRGFGRAKAFGCGLMLLRRA